jgi:hypothetical protein
MTIVEALQTENLRVSAGDRWLCGNGAGGWVVYSRSYGQKKTRCLIDTQSEQKAVAMLLHASARTVRKAPIVG